MKTTIDIPDELFRKAKATAALEGESLKDLICDALEAHLAYNAATPQEDRGWRSAFGRSTAHEVRDVDEAVERDLEVADPRDWR